MDKIEPTEIQFLEELIGETEMVSDYAPEMVLESIKAMCQQRLERIENWDSTDLAHRLVEKFNGDYGIENERSHQLAEEVLVLIKGIALKFITKHIDQ